MQRRAAIGTALIALAAVGVLQGPARADARTLTIGATAGPYADQLKYGIKPILEKKGYTVRLVEFSDYVQPNLALAQGALDANVFQHRPYLEKFAADHKLDIVPVVKVPTVPIGLYSRKHRSLTAVREGARVAMPNDPTNQARALVMMERLGWIRLKPGVDPLRVSERDVQDNIARVRLLPLEAALLPRSLDDTDYSFINGNYALASGLRLADALKLEENIDDRYILVVAVRGADAGRSFTRDIVEAYRSDEFRDVIARRFPGFVAPNHGVPVVVALRR